MGQKVNPIAVRLNFNRFSDYNWCSDYYYSTLFFQDINLQQYLNVVKQPNSNKLGFRVGKCIIHRFPKKSFLHLFCLSDPRDDSLPHGSSISSKFEIIKKKIDRQKDYQTFISKKSKHQLAEGIASRCGAVSRIEESNQLEKENDITFQNSIFWLNSSNQQKKRALINYFRSSGGPAGPIGPLGLFFTRKILKGCFAPSESTGPDGIFEKKTKAYDFFLKQKKKDCIINENSVKRIAENTKKYWNKRYNFQLLLAESQSVYPSFVGTYSCGAFKNNFLYTTGPVGPVGVGYFNFYTMHYYFLKNTNISNLGISKTQKTIQFLAKCEANRNFMILQVNHNLKQQIIKVFKINSTKSILDSKIERDQKTRLDINKMARSSFSMFRNLSNIQNVLSLTTNTSISLRPLKVHSIFHSANLVAQEIACKLEQKKSFRLICRLIFQQLILHPSIKGIRITCSGRINGAEIAKTECRKFGETSLHVFSDKIDYAQAIASTSYGILGVKVWISFI